MKIIGAVGLVIALFLIVYLPIFAVISALHLPKEAMIPAVISGTSIVAVCAIEFIRRRRRLSLAEFGLRLAPFRYFAIAMLISTPLGILAAAGASQIHEPGPLQGLVLVPALTWFYFGLAAPLQEEIIFRGLLQTVLTDRLQMSAVASWAGMFAVLVVGLLFAVIHLEVGPFTAASAFVLALLAGEFRRRSASIAPGVLCHAVFNLAAIILI